MNLNFDFKHMAWIKNFYLTCPEEMPKLYAINKAILSMNSMQPDRYLEKNFLYYNTLYHDGMRNQIDDLLSSELIFKIQLKGQMVSGKSYFLSDYVLRKRVKRQQAEFRILYINNSEQFLRRPLDYLFNELKYMVCFDFEQNGDLDFTKWLSILNKNRCMRNDKTYLEFLGDLKNYYNSKGIKVILIWDQINVLYRDENKADSGFKLFKEMTQSNLFFDHIILSASNNNKEINLEVEEIVTIEVDPFKVFNKREFRSLIEVEAALFNLIPSDVKKDSASQYFSELSDILNFSISEYFFYKSTAWDDDLFCFNIKDSTAKTNETNYCENRKIMIRNSEQKFRKEYLKSNDDLYFYYLNLQKIQVYDDKMHIFEKITVN